MSDTEGDGIRDVWAESVIWKHTAIVGETLRVPWQDGARVTGVEVGDTPETVGIWVHHPRNPMAGDAPMYFDIVSTDQPFPNYWEIVGTTRHAASGLVWHVARHS